MQRTDDAGAEHAPSIAVCLMGPTGTGKTALAAELVEQLPFAIVSVDSAMVYRGLDIGTAKPDAGLLARAPHRLIDVIEPSESYSAGRFARDALREMEAIRAQGRIPLLVGGTGLYFRALMSGLSPLPTSSPAIRALLDERRAAEGSAGLHRWLSVVDPPSAARIHPNDPQRVQRALEVFLLTGTPLSDRIAAGRQRSDTWHYLRLVLMPSDRAHLRSRLAQRFDTMLERGLVAEVKALYASGRVRDDSPALRLVGYRQVALHLAGCLDYASMRVAAIDATRQLAKRQLTWLRAEPDVYRLDSEDLDVRRSALKYLAEVPMLKRVRA